MYRHRYSNHHDLAMLSDYFTCGGQGMDVPDTGGGSARKPAEPLPPFAA